MSGHQHGAAIASEQPDAGPRRRRGVRGGVGSVVTLTIRPDHRRSVRALVTGPTPRTSWPAARACRPPGSAARSRSRAARRGDDEQLVAHAQPGVDGRGERLVVAHDEAHRGAARQPQLAQVDPAAAGSRPARGPAAGRRPARRAARRRPRSRGARPPTTPSSRRDHDGSVVPCSRVSTTTSTNTASTSRCAFGAPSCSAMRASTIGTAPRRPDQDRNACSRHGTRNGSAAAITESGRAASSSTTPAIERGDDGGRPAAAARRRARAARTGRSGRASPCPRRTTARRRGAAGWSCRGPARRRRSRAARRRARTARRVGRAGSTAIAASGYRPVDGQRGAPQRPGARRARARPDDRTRQQLVDHQDRGEPRDRLVRGEQR